MSCEVCWEKNAPHFCGRRGCDGPQNCCRAVSYEWRRSQDREATKIRANVPQFLSGASAALRWSIGAGHGFRLLMTIKSNVFCLFDSERSPQFCIRNCGLLSIAQRIMALLHSTATGRFHSGAPPCAGTGRPQPSAPAGSLAAPPFRPSAPRYDPPRPRCASDGR